MSWRRAHLGTSDQILILSEFRCVVFVGRPLWREVGFVSCQSLSAIIIHCQFFLLFLFVFSRHTFYVYTIYARPSQPRLSTADHAPSFLHAAHMALWRTPQKTFIPGFITGAGYVRGCSSGNSAKCPIQSDTSIAWRPTKDTNTAVPPGKREADGDQILEQVGGRGGRGM
jgi:hypothetical protein